MANALEVYLRASQLVIGRLLDHATGWASLREVLDDPNDVTADEIARVWTRYFGIIAGDFDAVTNFWFPDASTEPSPQGPKPKAAAAPTGSGVPAITIELEPKSATAVGSTPIPGRGDTRLVVAPPQRPNGGGRIMGVQAVVRGHIAYARIPGLRQLDTTAALGRMPGAVYPPGRYVGALYGPDDAAAPVAELVVVISA